MTTLNEASDIRADVSSQEKDKEHHFNIQIDRVHYKVQVGEMSGASLRSVPEPAIGHDRDLFEVMAGAPDRKIADTDVVELHSGKRFFTAPGQINPGSL
jgi:hypothetical protein